MNRVFGLNAISPEQRDAFLGVCVKDVRCVRPRPKQAIAERRLADMVERRDFLRQASRKPLLNDRRRPRAFTTMGGERRAIARASRIRRRRRKQV